MAFCRMGRQLLWKLLDKSNRRKSGLAHVAGCAKLTRPGQRARVVEGDRSGRWWISLTPDWGISGQSLKSLGMSDTMVSTSLSLNSPLYP